MSTGEMPGGTQAAQTRRNNRKEQIAAAAERLLHEKGLAAVTTRAIAEAVPCSEGAIYVHFPNRLQLILTVFERALRDMLVPLRALELEVGTNTPAENLTRAVTALAAFHQRVVPMLCSMFAEAQLLQGFRETLAARQKGPGGAIGRVASYIRAEQAGSRIPPDIDPEFAGATLMAGSFFAAFHDALLGGSPKALRPERLVREAILAR